MKHIHIPPFAKPKVKQQIILLFLLAGIVPIMIVGIFSIIRAREQMSEQYESQAQSDAFRVNSALFDITTSLFTTTENVVSTTQCRALFGSDYHSQNNTMYYNYITSSLETIRNNTGSISSISIYTNNPNIPDNAYIHSVPDGYASQQWYLELNENQWNNWTYINTTNTFQQTTCELALIKRIATISPDYTAYLVVCVDSNYIKNRLMQNDYTILASVDGKPVFFSTDTSRILTDMVMPEDFNKEYYKYTGPLTIDGQSTLTDILTLRPYKTDNLFYISILDFEAYHNINQITLIYSLILAAATLLPAILILLFSSYFSGRVKTLKQAMHQASLGDYNIIDTFEGDDELAQTFQDLNRTVEMIRDKEALYYQAQIQEQKLINKQQQMEFKMLSSQINPHFLYNTLETIRMQALASDNREVAVSIKLLGKSMHYVLENTGTDQTTLARELEYVKIYLSIQQLRFGDRVNYDFHIPDNFHPEQYKILPLLLQPVVENAITHGLESIQENGHIDVSIHTSERALLITVTDNGDGMDEDSLLQLNKRLNNKPSNSSSSIGLYNIHQRIKLMYGLNYGLTITSVLHQGTTVTLTLPLTTTE